MRELSADYVVVGTGATAMAFLDRMLDEGDATFIMVDRRAKAGGHWNECYPFIRLNVPARLYGVNSTPWGTAASTAAAATAAWAICRAGRSQAISTG